MVDMSLQTAVKQFGSSHAVPERAERSCILTINVGSSSLKFALFALADPIARLLSGRVDRIGMPASRLVVIDAQGGQEESTVTAPDQAAAVALVTDLLSYLVGLKNIAIVGHRVVHGGNRFYRPELITTAVLDDSWATGARPRARILCMCT
jgi:acetate kinase